MLKGRYLFLSLWDDSETQCNKDGSENVCRATSLLLIPVFLFNNCCLVLLPAYNGKEKKKATKGFAEPKVMLIIELFFRSGGDNLARCLNFAAATFISQIVSITLFCLFEFSFFFPIINKGSLLATMDKSKAKCQRQESLCSCFVCLFIAHILINLPPAPRL